MATQKGKFHISEKGLAVPCDATIKACPRVHGDSPESARQAYEQHMGAEGGSFAPAIKKSARAASITAPESPAFTPPAERTDAEKAARIASLTVPGSNPNVPKLNGLIASYNLKKLIDNRLAQAESTLAGLDAPEVQKHISVRLSRVEVSVAKVNDTLPGSPERDQAIADRGVDRAELVASDIALWRKSEYYTPEIEAKMRENVKNSQDADYALEASLADSSSMASTSGEYGIDSTETRSVLEYVHRDYLRPRGGLNKPLSELADDGTYVAGVAQQYRLPIDTVRGVILSASSKTPVTS